jgi:hypothetical protein
MVTSFVVTLTMALMFAAGLAYDAGRLVDARIAAADTAAGAARAGRASRPSSTPPAMSCSTTGRREAADDFVTDPAYGVHVDASAGAVTVTVSRTLGMAFLRLFGLGHKALRRPHR